MHIKLTVRWTFQTNNYRCIGFITKIIIGLIVSQFMYSLGYSLIVCPYTLDSMNSYKIIFNRFTKIVVFWNGYDNAIEYVTQQLCCIFLLKMVIQINNCPVHIRIGTAPVQTVPVQFGSVRNRVRPYMFRNGTDPAVHIAN